MASQPSSSDAVFLPTPQHLRELVLDYLLHNSYIETSRAFAKDTAGIIQVGVGRGDIRGSSPLVRTGRFEVDETMSDDLGAIDEGMATGGVPEEILGVARLRREIRLQILSGRVDEATQLLNSHFPFVLQENDSEIHPPINPPQIVTSPSPHAKVNFTSQLSTKPIHISLNLRILAFIEAARTVALPYPPDSSRPTSISTSSSTLATNCSSDAFSAHQTALLHRAQRLYATVESLKDMRDRDIYREELKSVGGLLAYPAPEESPMANYMGQDRREAVANQVNSAILSQLGQPAVSHIELYARQTSTVWSTMHDLKLPLPPLSQQPAGIAIPLNASTESLATKSGNCGKAERVPEAEFVPLFDLQQFLDTP